MSKQQSQRRSDHDSPWKMALDTYFQKFLELLFPAIHKQIDWSQGYSFLDKELQQITADASSGRRYADKLIKIFAKDGHETWVLIHVEVQGEPEDAFAERMYTYQYRLRDRYQVDVVSLAVLADTHQNYRPKTFHYQRWGCELTFTFPTAKLIDWEPRWSELEVSENVFALVVKAQIHAKRIKDGTTRQEVKVGLIRLLFERNYNREQIVELFNIIDWMIQLPEGLEKDFVRIVYEIQEDKQMAYINTIERYERQVAVEEGMKQGVQQGMQQGMQQGRKEGMQLGTQAILKSLLQIKFGALPEWAIQQLQQASQEQLEQWAGAILTAESLEAVLKQS